MKHNNDVSRRTFITTAAGAGVAAGMAAASIPVCAIAEGQPGADRSRSEEPLEQVLKRYGSELGDVNRIR